MGIVNITDFDVWWLGDAAHKLLCTNPPKEAVAQAAWDAATVYAAERVALLEASLKWAMENLGYVREIAYGDRERCKFCQDIAYDAASGYQEIVHKDCCPYTVAIRLLDWKWQN